VDASQNSANQKEVLSKDYQNKVPRRNEIRLSTAADSCHPELGRWPSGSGCRSREVVTGIVLPRSDLQVCI
jgi:hypothetical protein